MKSPKTALIITTYNNVQGLVTIIESISRQFVLPDAVYIADDGSSDQTANYLESVREKFSFGVTHIWHEDDGYRRSAILNKAILAVKEDYIVFLDGDQILHRRFVQDHCELRERNTVILGTRPNLTYEDQTPPIKAPSVFELLFKFVRGEVTNEVRTQQTSTQSRITGLLKGIHLSGKKAVDCDESATRGGNMAAWRTALEEVNGFDEDFKGWGYEDTDMTIRLKRSGQKLKQARFRAVCFHIDHPAAPPNYENRKYIHEERPIFCLNGIKKEPNSP